MSGPNASLIKRLWIYLRDDAWRPSLFFVMLGGYAVTLGWWELSQGADLYAYVLYNYSATGGPSLTMLLSGIGLAVVVWALLGSLTAALTDRPLHLVMGRLSSLFLASSLLAFVPILRLPGAFPLSINDPQAKIILSVAALSAALVAGLALYTWSSFGSSIRTAEQTEQSVPSPVALGIVVVMVGGYIAAMSALMLVQHASLATHAFDLGIQDQAFYSILKRGYPLVTLYDTGSVNQFGDHFTPIYYLIVPLYALVGDARALLVIQTLALGLAAVPLFALARLLLRSDWLAVALVMSYLLHPALQGINSFDFHEIALAPLPLLGAFYFFERDRKGWMWLCLILAMMTKEEVALTVLAFAFYLWVDRRRARLALTVGAVALLYFFIVNYVVMPALGGGPDVGRFSELALQGGFRDLAATLLGNPLFVARYVLLNPAKLAFLLIMLVPVVLLPVRARGRWLIALPGLGVALLSSFPAQYDIVAHYPAILLPSLYYLTIGGAQRIEFRRWAAPLAVAIVTASLVMTSQYGYLVGRQLTHISHPSDHDRAIHYLIQQIPPTASVSALSDFVPHLSNRDQIYIFPTVNNADYILFDTHSKANFWPLTRGDIDPRAAALEGLAPYLDDGRYGVLEAADGAFLIQRSADAAHNRELLISFATTSFDAGQMAVDERMTIRPDPASSWGSAVVSNALPEPAPWLISLVYGPYTSLPLPGRYQLDFHLKLTDPPQEGEVALIDVYSEEQGGSVTDRHLRVEDFVVGAYEGFSLTLDLEAPLNRAEFRVLHNGQGTLWYDRVDVSYLGE